MIRIAVTVEEESWVVRRIAERFQELAGDACEVVPVKSREPVPADAHVVIYTDWPHYHLQPPALRKMIPGVLMVHHLDRFAFRLRLAAFREDIRITCMSMRWLNFLRRWTIPAHQLSLVRHGVDLGVFQPAKNLIAGGRVCIGVVGRPYPCGRKGEDMLLAIARQLAPEKYELQFMGERWEEQVETLKRWGFAVATAEKCPETEQAAIYQRMDCLLVCSRNEGGPLPVLEALACGVPVISTDVGFLPELKEQMPFAIRIFDSESSAIKQLLAARELKAEVSRRREEIRNRLADYSWSRWAGTMVEIAIATAGGVRGTRYE